MSMYLCWMVPLLLTSLEVDAKDVAVARVEPASSPVSGYDKVALMPLSSLGSTDEAVTTIQRILENELDKLMSEKLITPAQLDAQDQPVRVAFRECSGAVFCLVEVVGGLGWDAFIVGNVAGLGERRVINLKLIDVRSGRDIRKSSEKASGEETELIKRIRKAAVHLVAPERFTGKLNLNVAQAGVRVLVDGQLVGISPLQADHVVVTAGKHAIEAQKDGYVPFSTMTDLAYDEVKQVTIELPRSSAFVGGDTPFRHRWWTWALAGAGVLATGMGGYFNYLHADTVDRIESRLKSGRFNADDAELYDDQQAHWNRSLIFYGTGGLLLGTTGVLFSLDFL